MEIQKLGHCCMVIKESGKTILTDPGMYSDAQNSITGIDAILITHEHGDHFHVESVKAILQNNPAAVVITNTAVGKLLDKEHIPYQIVEDGQSAKVGELSLEGFGTIHAEIYKTLPRVQNTGYMIAGKLCYPGDAFEMPKAQPEIIALPVAGPWMKISESIDYALSLKPKFVFPVHDAFLKSGGFFYTMVKNLVEPQNIQFVEPKENEFMKF